EAELTGLRSHVRQLRRLRARGPTRLRLSLRNGRARRRLVLPGSNGGRGLPALLQGQDCRRVRAADESSEARRARSLPLAGRNPAQQGVRLDDGNGIMTP